MKNAPADDPSDGYSALFASIADKEQEQCLYLTQQRRYSYLENL
jgi:hypothetical protein